MSKDVKSGVPKEAQAMASILKEMGITDYEPGVIQQMLEFAYGYTTQILDDGRAYANYSRKGKPIEIEDIKLAVQMQVDKCYTTPPPRELLLEFARQRNANPLPPIKSQCGIRLPPDRYCLSNCNFKLKSAPKKAGRSTGVRNIKMENAANKPNISMVTTKTGNGQNVTLVQKPSNAASAAPTQKIVSVNRPLIKVTPGPPVGTPTPKIQVSSLPQANLKVATIKQEEPEPRKRKRDDSDF